MNNAQSNVISASVVMAPNRLAPLHPDCRGNWRKVAEAIGAEPFREHLFTVYQCECCGMGFTDPIPTEETAPNLYTNRGASTQFQADESPVAATIRRFFSKREAKSVCRELPLHGRFLDFGCGNGAFAIAVHQAFPDAQILAADQHPTAPNGIVQKFYISYDDLIGRKGQFDFIACRHVLEHSYDPLGLIEYLRSLLAPGGVLAIEVPSFETKLRRLFGRYWDLYYAPYHTVHFTAGSLRRMVEAAGMTVIRTAGVEMPKMGRNIQNVLGCDYNLGLFLLGAALHPLQVAIGGMTGTSVCLRLWARRD